MSQAAKAIARLQTKPTDFTWNEFVAVMEQFGYKLNNGNGSRRSFIHPETKLVLFMHEPHPSKVLKAYQVREALGFLKEYKHL